MTIRVQSDMVCSALCTQMLCDVVRCCALCCAYCAMLQGLEGSRGRGVAVSITMVVSEYKYVSWHPNMEKYIAQVTRRGKRIYKAFSEESQAVAYLVRLTRKPEAHLRRDFYRKQQQVMHHWSAYKYIAWHCGIQKSQLDDRTNEYEVSRSESSLTKWSREKRPRPTPIHATLGH